MDQGFPNAVRKKYMARLESENSTIYLKDANGQYLYPFLEVFSSAVTIVSGKTWKEGKDIGNLAYLKYVVPSLFSKLYYNKGIGPI